MQPKSAGVFVSNFSLPPQKSQPRRKTRHVIWEILQTSHDYDFGKQKRTLPQILKLKRNQKSRFVANGVLYPEIAVVGVLE